MKRIFALCALLLLLLCMGGCGARSGEETRVQFNGITLNSAGLSEETLQWLQWYNALPEEEQLSISYIPSDLYDLCGYAGQKDLPAETN